MSLTTWAYWACGHYPKWPWQSWPCASPSPPNFSKASNPSAPSPGSQFHNFSVFDPRKNLATSPLPAILVHQRAATCQKTPPLGPRDSNHQFLKHRQKVASKTMWIISPLQSRASLNSKVGMRRSCATSRFPTYNEPTKDAQLDSSMSRFTKGIRTHP